MAVLNLQVSAGADDGRVQGGSIFANNESGIVVGGLFGDFDAWFRFTSVTIPNSAIIDTAKLNIQASIDRSTTPVNWDIFGNDSDNAAAPANASAFVSAPRTTAKVDWDNVAAFVSGTRYDSPEISSVVQEIVDRVGWSSGNALTLFVENDGGAANRGVSGFESGSSNAAQLNLEYTPSNTAPTITVNPSFNYNGYTRTGPNNTPISVTFEAEDDEEDGTDELTVEVRTAASGGGTLVATDDYTSGDPGSISIAHNASGLSEGSNTLYMRVGDGTDWSDDESFTLLVDRTAPADFTPSITPTLVGVDKEYYVSLTANDTHSTGTDELTWQVRTAASGGGSLLAYGSRTRSGSAFNTSTFTDSGLSPGSNTRYVRVIDGAGNVREKSVSVPMIMTVLKVATSTLGLASAVARRGLSWRVVTTAVGLLSASVRRGASIRLVSSTIGIMHGLVRRAASIRRVGDNLGLHSVSGRKAVTLRLVGDAVGIASGALRTFGRFVIADSVVSIGSTTARRLIYEVVKVASSAMGVVESMIRFGGQWRVISSSVGITDATAKWFHSVRLASSSLSITSGLVRAGVSIRSVVEVVGVQSAFVRLMASVRSAGSVVGLASVVVRRGISNISLSSSLSILSASNRVFGSWRVVADAIGIGSATRVVPGIMAFASNTVGIVSSTVTAFRTVLREVRISVASRSRTALSRAGSVVVARAGSISRRGRSRQSLGGEQRA